MSDNDDRGVTAAAVERIVEKFGGELKAIDKLMAENYELRADRRTLKEEVKELRTQLSDAGVPEGHKVVPSSAVVLDDKQKETWIGYQELGQLSDIRSAIEAGQSASDELLSMKRRQSINEVAEAMRWNPKVLARLGETLEYKVESDDKKGTRVLVKEEDGDFLPLSDYADSNWSEFLPSLSTSTGRQVITQSPPQDGAPKTKSDEAIEAEIQRRHPVSF
jgi:hypothetical protein